MGGELYERSIERRFAETEDPGRPGERAAATGKLVLFETGYRPGTGNLRSGESGALGLMVPNGSRTGPDCAL